MIVNLESTVDKSVIFLEVEGKNKVTPFFVDGALIMNSSDVKDKIKNILNFEVDNPRNLIKYFSQSSQDILDKIYENTFYWESSGSKGVTLKNIEKYTPECIFMNNGVFDEHYAEFGFLLEEIEFDSEEGCKELFNFLLVSNGETPIPDDISLNHYFNYKRVEIFTTKFPNRYLLYKTIEGKITKIHPSISNTRGAFKFSKDIPFDVFIAKLELKNSVKTKEYEDMKDQWFSYIFGVDYGIE